MANPFTLHPASYRDRSGFVFKKDNIVYRQVNTVFKDDFDFFISSGCYEHLVKKKLLIPHRVINENLTGSAAWYTTLQPEHIPFISYPYEWSFDMLKDAALLTLQLMKEALGYGLVLKDATPYNIQWHQGQWQFIDTLSFEKHKEEPWIAYRQFCETFLGPLLIMHYKKMHLQQLMLAWPDGIPVAVIKSMLPWRSRFSLHIYLHIHLQARLSLQKAGEKKITRPFLKQKLQNLLLSLETLIRRLSLLPAQSTWSDYYSEAAQRDDYLQHKRTIIGNWLNKLPAVKTALDAGANTGEFSKLIAGKQIQTIAADFDPACINHLYTELKKTGEKNIQPLILDLSNPSPANGVNNEERTAFIDRASADLVTALAAVHHLAIGKNIPFMMIADLFSRCGKHLIIEFVPKQDEKVQLMLSRKKDIYTDYTEENFVAAFGSFFVIKEKQQIGSSGRSLYLMSRHDN